MALASLELITKLIIVTSTFLTSSSMWMDSNSSGLKSCPFSRSCSNLVQIFESCCCPWLSSIALSPGFQPIGWLGALLLSLVSILPLSLRLLGVLRRGKFLILGSAYPRVLSAPKEDAGFDRQGCDNFSTIFRASRNPTFRWAMILLISFCFLITGYRSLFTLWLPSQFRHFF
jgi:hypothetical protein